MNGEISFSSDDTAPFDFSTVAVYSCDAGFGLSGDKQRTCAGDGDDPMGEWSGLPPSCAGTRIYLNVSETSFFRRTKFCNFHKFTSNFKNYFRNSDFFFASLRTASPSKVYYLC